MWVTSVDTRQNRGYIHQFDRRTGKFERRLEITDGVRYHPGGMAIQGGAIWVPVAEYKANSSAVLIEIDKETLTVRRKIAVADHIGCVAASAKRSGRRQLGQPPALCVRPPGPAGPGDQQPLADPLPGHEVRAGPAGRLRGARPRGRRHRLVCLAVDEIVDSRAAGATDRGIRYTEEGMALQGRDLYLVPEDGPSRMFRFKLTRGSR
ncbi:DUF6454 family protein [Caulobacter segnis]